MPDITMCNNEDCKQKEQCYRYKAKPTPYRQSYWADSVVDEKRECEYFMQINK